MRAVSILVTLAKMTGEGGMPVQQGRWRRGRGVVAAAVVAFVGTVSVGCAQGSAAGAQEQLTISIQGGPGSLNPIQASTASQFDVLNNTMEGLVRIGPTGVPQGGIARSWNVSGDGLTYTFTLRNAKWSNGDAVTAQQFVDAWRQALDPRTASAYSSAFSYIQGAQALLQLQLPDQTKDPSGYQTAVAKIPGLLKSLGVQATGAHTLVVHLAQPTPYWLELTALPPYFPVDSTFVQKVGASHYGGSAQDVLSDGPFQLASWQHGGKLVLTRNPDYWDAGAVRLQQVTLLEVTQPATEVNLWNTGQIDITTPSLPQGFITRFKGTAGFQSAAEATSVYVVTNTHNTALANPLIRQAFSLAVNRQQLAQDVVRGNALPAYALVPPVIDYTPGQPFTNLVGKVLPLSANATQAKRDLAQGLNALGLKQMPAVTLLTLNNSAQQTQGQALQAMWKQVLGVQVNLQPLDPNTFFADLQQGQFDLGLLGWNADYNDPTTFLNLFLGNSSMNLTGWNNATFNQDLQAAQGTVSASARGRDLAAASRLLLSQLPVIPLYWTSRNWMVRPDVHGFVVYPTGPDYSLKWTYVG